MAEYIEREAALETAKKSHLYFDLKPIINSVEGELISGYVVTHWVPLPQPPKGGMSMKECCANCRRRYKLTKFDYSHGGCEHTDMDGYICMAFANEKQAVWMVGSREQLDLCECFEAEEGE